MREKENRATRAPMMQIGEISKRTGVGVDAIRFYERSGLLSKPVRSKGGFRLYEAHDASTLLFIRRMQKLGFSLPEIRDLLELRSHPLRACAPVRNRLHHKLLHVRAKIRELQSLRCQLVAALARCDRELRKRPAHCPILKSVPQPHRRSSQ